MGANITPTAKKSGSTVLGVRMGCHAFRRCCRKALSVQNHQRYVPPTMSACSHLLTGRPSALLRLLWFLVAPSATARIVLLHLHGLRHLDPVVGDCA